jgi:DNA-binding NtrC family response regulator
MISHRSGNDDEPLPEMRRILSVSPFEDLHRALRAALDCRLWRIEEASNCRKAIGCLCLHRMDMVVCDQHLPDGSWIYLHGYLTDMVEPPVLIVRSHSSDDRLRQEVKCVGAEDMISASSGPDEIRRVLAIAWETAARRPVEGDYAAAARDR